MQLHIEHTTDRPSLYIDNKLSVIVLVELNAV